MYGPITTSASDTAMFTWLKNSAVDVRIVRRSLMRSTIRGISTNSCWHSLSNRKHGTLYSNISCSNDMRARNTSDDFLCWQLLRRNDFGDGVFFLTIPISSRSAKMSSTSSICSSSLDVDMESILKQSLSIGSVCSPTSHTYNVSAFIDSASSDFTCVYFGISLENKSFDILYIHMVPTYHAIVYDKYKNTPNGTQYKHIFGYLITYNIDSDAYWRMTTVCLPTPNNGKYLSSQTNAKLRRVSLQCNRPHQFAYSPTARKIDLRNKNSCKKCLKKSLESVRLAYLVSRIRRQMAFGWALGALNPSQYNDRYPTGAMKLNRVSLSRLVWQCLSEIQSRTNYDSNMRRCESAQKTHNDMSWFTELYLFACLPLFFM